MKREDAITLLIVIVVIYALYKLNAFFKGAAAGLGAPEGAQSGGSEETQANPAKLTFPSWKYEQLADEIEADVWGGLAFTENDDEIEAALKQLQTDDDFIQLSNAYGVRGRGLVLRDYYNLVQTLDIYLDDDNRENVNAYFASKNMLIRI
jgi:hypothetical protein